MTNEACVDVNGGFVYFVVRDPGLGGGLTGLSATSVEDKTGKILFDKPQKSPVTSDGNRMTIKVKATINKGNKAKVGDGDSCPDGGNVTITLSDTSQVSGSVAYTND